MRVFDLTDGAGEVLYPESDVTRSLNGEFLELGPWDAIIGGDFLCTVEPFEVVQTVHDWAGALKERGRLHMQAPSLEWFAREAVAGRVNPPLWSHLFGREHRPYRAAFRMNDLRLMIKMVGLTTVAANTGTYVIVKDAKTEAQYVGELHNVIAMKIDLEEDGWVEPYS
jgi:hypothetical protein